MQRELGTFEQAALLSAEQGAWNIVSVLELAGAPTPESLRAALAWLQARHPLLRARIVQKGHKPQFVADVRAPIPLEVLAWSSEQDWQPLVERELNRPFEHTNGPLLRLIYLADPPRQGILILTALHAIADGSALEALLQALLQHCAALESGVAIAKLESQPLPAPAEMLFPPAYQGFKLQAQMLRYLGAQMQDELSYQWKIRDQRKPPIRRIARVKVISFQLPADATGRLVQQARNAGVTLNSLLQAALLVAAQQQLYANAARPFRYMSWADLRPYLDPPAAPEQLACYIAPLRFTVDLCADQEIWPLANRIQAQIYQAGRRGEKFVAAAMTKAVMQMTFGLGRMRLCATALSYSGPTGLEDLPGPYQVRAVHGFITNFGLGPEFAGRAGLFRDELVWDLLYLDSDMNTIGAQQMVTVIRRLLTEAMG